MTDLHRISRRSAGAVALVALAGGCRSTPSPAADSMTVSIPERFSGDVSSAMLDTAPWWTTFGAASLDTTIEAALGGNLELRQAWTRLRQAEASSRVAGAPRYPTVDLNASVTEQRIEQRGDSGAGGFIPIRTGEVYSLGISAGYEVDLFGRIDSELRAARLEEVATAADVEATGLTLSGTVSDAWFTAVESYALIDLVTEQVRVGEQLLEVTETRFGTGSGSALDVLQQRRQLEGTRAEIPRLEGDAERALYQLSVLTGRPPGDIASEPPRALPALPPLPALDVPIAILENRPDVVAAARRVESADASVAAAIADRYPRFTLSASYNFDGTEIENILDRSIASIIADLVTPLVDGGRRRAEVERQRAVLDGAIDAFQLAVLTALQEVEEALSLERRGIERIVVLDRQATIARDELAQARFRYVSGVDNYLTVLAAVQNLQQLERSLVSERASVLRARTQLHRALGGAWTETLERPDRSPAQED
ncbi:MAG: efflux transporter outer membrane subunit [Planctomycetota bacterium]